MKPYRYNNMDISVFRMFLCCFFLVCGLSISEGERLMESDINNSLETQGLIQSQEANSRSAPLDIVKRSTTKTVDIAMFTDSSPPGKFFSVYVDSTMTRLLIEVKVDKSNPLAILTKPSGLPGPRQTLNGTGPVTATIDVAITSADYGIWKLNKFDANTWDVKIQGESPLDFSYQFLEDAGFFQVPITGDPIQGETYKTVITVAGYASIQSLDIINVFVPEKSTPANMLFPTDKGGGKYEIAKLPMLDKDFMIGIQGKDQSGNFYRRMAVIKPIALILSVPSFTSGVKWYENTKLDLTFYVINKLKNDQDIDVRIQDTQGLTAFPTIISATLKPGENYTGKFMLNAGLLGVTTTVTITAKPYLGRGQVSHGPSEVGQFTVESNQTTTTSTPTTTTSPSTSSSTTKSTSLPTTSTTTTSPSTSTATSKSTSLPTTPPASSTKVTASSTKYSTSATTQSSTTKTIDIAMFTDSSAPGKSFSVYVDSTMTRLIIEVKVDRSNPVATLTKPSGIPGPSPTLKGTASAGLVTATIDVAITSADYGIWKLNKLDVNTWNVKIQGESPLDFTYQFLEGSLMQPITGDPIQGETYKTVITVAEYAKIQSVDMIMVFVPEKSAPANMLFPIINKGGGKYEIATLTMLDKDFMIGIQGRDKSGKFFRRIAFIKPITLILSVPSFASGVKWYENTKLDITFFAINKLKTNQVVDVKIQDTQGFAEAPTTISATLKPGENYTGKFVLKVGLLGVTTTVTLTATPTGHGQVSEVKQFTVESNQTTTTSNSTTTTSPSTSTSTTASTSLPSTSPASSTKVTASSTKYSTSATSQVTSNTLSVKSSSAAPSISNLASSASSKTTTTGKPATTGSAVSPVSQKQSTAAVSSGVSSGVSSRTSKSGTTVTSGVSTGVSSGTSKSGTTVTTGVSSGVSSGTSKSGTTKAQPKASAATVSALATTLAGSKVSTTRASGTFSVANLKVSTAPLTAKSQTTTNGKLPAGSVKSTVPPATKQAHVSALSASSIAVGKITTQAPEGSKDETFSKGEIFGAAVVSGVSAGVLIGVAALVTMGLVFKHSINKTKVEPDQEKKRTLSEHNQLAWT